MLAVCMLVLPVFGELVMWYETENENVCLMIIDENAIAPFDIWVDGKLVAENYPSWIYNYPHENKESLTFLVEDSEGQTGIFTAYPELQSFPMRLWIGIVAVIAFALLSFWIPISSVVSFLISGSMMLYVIPNFQYIPMLKIIMGFVFIVSLTTLFINIRKGVID